MLDFRIETFLAACRHMNFTAAAEELHITQPAVSQHIRFLEKKYGAELFVRDGKRLEAEYVSPRLIRLEEDPKTEDPGELVIQVVDKHNEILSDTE